MKFFLHIRNISAFYPLLVLESCRFICCIYSLFFVFSVEYSFVVFPAAD